jgi:hypothetical protein
MLLAVVLKKTSIVTCLGEPSISLLRGGKNLNYLLLVLKCGEESKVSRAGTMLLEKKW